MNEPTLRHQVRHLLDTNHVNAFQVLEETGVTTAALNAWLSSSSDSQLDSSRTEAINQRMQRFIQRIKNRKHAFHTLLSRYLPAAPPSSRVASPSVYGEDLITLNLAVSATLDPKRKTGCGVVSYADSVLWNRHEKQITPRHFLEQTCRDLRVEPEIFLDTLEQQMKDQIKFFDQLAESKTVATEGTNNQSGALDNVSASPYVTAVPFPSEKNSVPSNIIDGENVFDRNRNLGGRFPHRERHNNPDGDDDDDAAEEQDEPAAATAAAEENEEGEEEEKASGSDASEEENEEADDADANQMNDDAAPGEQKFVRLEIDVVFDGYRVQQNVIWDRASTLITPEEFAQTFCSELSTPAEFAPKVAVQIRDQLQSGLSMKKRPLKTYAVPPSVDASMLNPTKALSFTPQIYPLTVRASIVAFQKPPRPYVAHYTSENHRHALMVGPLIDGNEGRKKAIEKGHPMLDIEMNDEEEDRGVPRRGRPPKAYFAAALAAAEPSAYMGQSAATTAASVPPSSATSAYAARRAKKVVAKPKPRYFVLVATDSFIRLRDANSMQMQLVPVTEPIFIPMNTSDNDGAAPTAAAASSSSASHKRKRADPRSPVEEVESEESEEEEQEEEEEEDNEPPTRITISINKKRMRVTRVRESPLTVTPFTLRMRRASRRLAAEEEREKEIERDEEEDVPTVTPFSIRRRVVSQPASSERADPVESPILFVTPDFLVLRKSLLPALPPRPLGRTRRR